MCGVVVAAVCAEGEFQAGSLGGADDVFVRDVRDFVDLDGELRRPSSRRARLSLFRGNVSLWRRCAAQEAFGAKVFVEIGPVDAEASARDFPIAALSGSGVEQAWIPHQWHADHAAIPQRDT